MENTGLTMGRDKNVPLRVLLLGFGFLFVQLGAASLAALLGYQGVSAGWGITLRSTSIPWDVGNLSSLVMLWRIRGGRAGDVFPGLLLPGKGRKRPKVTFLNLLKSQDKLSAFVLKALQLL